MTLSTSTSQAGLALFKPRFLVALAFVLGFTFLTLNHKEKLDNVYNQLPAIRQQTTHTGKSTTERLALSEKIYQKSLRERHAQLQRGGYGTDAFQPWHPYMNWWWYFQPAFTCPHEIERIGYYGDGGKWVCGFSLLEAEKNSGKKCVVYSFGVNGDSTFESEIVQRTNCDVWAYDASVPDMAGDAKGNPRIHFNKVFVGAEDKVDADGNVWKTLKTIMKENGHEWIDILKMDIESSEYGSMSALMDSWNVLPFSQIQIELHLQNEMDLRANDSFKKFLNWFERLEKWNLRPFWSELNVIPMLYSQGRDGFFVCEYSFINTAGNHALLQD